MNFKEKLLKVLRLASAALFGFAVFAITYTSIDFLYVFFVFIFDINIYTQTGEIRYDLFPHLYFALAGLIIGIIGSYYLNKKKWIYKFFPYLLISFLPFTWIIGNATHFKMRELEHSSQRINLLRAVHGEKVEPCNLLHIGDNISKVTELYGEPMLKSFHDLAKTKSGRMVNSKLFQLPFQAPYFTVHFNPNDFSILEIECFNEKWKKAKGSQPDTVYEYIEE